MARVRKPKVDKSGRTSAGILLWRRREGRLEVLLGHPGGPYFAGKDADQWTVLKGEVDSGEDLLVVARREFEEETGHKLPKSPAIELGDIHQKSGKRVLAWAVEGYLDPETAVSNTFEMEWPPHSGRIRKFPEIDRVAWFELGEARVKIKGTQAAFLERLERIVADERPAWREKGRDRSRNRDRDARRSDPVGRTGLGGSAQSRVSAGLIKYRG